MSDTGSHLRAVFESIAPPIDIAAVMTGERIVPDRRRGMLIAAVAAAAVLVVALAGWLLVGRRGAEPPVATTPPAVTSTTGGTTTTVPADAGEVVRLEPVEGLDPVQLSTSIGEIEFTTYVHPRWPDGEEPPWSLTQTAHGIVGYISKGRLAWSLDGITWTEIGPATEPSEWPDPAAGLGSDVLVLDEDDLVATWDGAGWALAGTLSPMLNEANSVVTGPHGIVVVLNTSVYRWDGVGFTKAARPPDRPLRSGSGTGCAGWENGLAVTWMPGLEPVVATDDGFVALVPTRGEYDWPPNLPRNTTLCEPLVWFSPDGDEWAPTTDRSPFGEGAVVHDLAVAGGRIVAVGYLPVAAGDTRFGQAAAWVSDDGITWERTVLEPRIDLPGGPYLQVAGGSRGWIAAGYQDMWFSPDGHVWDGPYERPPGWDGDFFGFIDVAMLDDRIVGGSVVVGVFLGE